MAGICLTLGKRREIERLYNDDMRPSEIAAAVRTAYRLNVSKTKLYRLAKQYYPEIGPMKAATFIKYPRSRDYALDFKAGEHYHHLFLSVCGGQARLGDDCSTYDNEGERVSRWECRSLTLDELRALDMVEEVGA